MDALEKKLRYARTTLAITSPFFAHLVMHIPTEFVDEAGPFNTAYTDGKRIVFGKQFAQKLSREEFTAVLMHEALHVAFLHVQRMANRIPQRWNIATDLAINTIINEEAKRVTAAFGTSKFVLPSDALLDPSYANMTAEEIYEKLPDMPESKIIFSITGSSGEDSDQNSGGSGQGSYGLQGDIQVAKDPDAQGPDFEAEMKGVLVQAAQAAKLQGKVPLGVERYVDALLYPPQDWRTVLQELVEAFPIDFVYQPPDRRFHDYDFVIPSLSGEAVDFVVAFDTSGSITEQELRHYLSETFGILNAFDYVRMRIFMIDAEIHEDYEITSYDDIGDFMRNVRFTGGGGTDFRPVFERLAEDDSPKALVYFTDGYGTFPEEAPTYPVLWVLTPNSIDPQEVPFGRVVKLQPNS